MVVPVTLIEPMTISIEQIDKTQQPPLPGGGINGQKFPNNHVPRKTKVQLQAQVVFGNVDQDGNHTQMGTDEQQKGYILVLFNDLKKKGIELKRGDKITEMKTTEGTIAVELFLLHSSGDFAAHVSGSFALTRIEFQDRKPEGP